jgi:phospholipid-translocating ATPase
MGIMVREGSKITYYLKGADTVMQSKIPSSDSHFMAEACLDLANEGLRTLVIAQRSITPECNSLMTQITQNGRKS